MIIDRKSSIYEIVGRDIMNSPDVTTILRLLSDRSRITILDILMDGRAYTVNEITAFTKLKQHTVSYHLKLLTEAKLTAVKQYGKFRYYSISNTMTPELFEFLSNYSPVEPTKSYKQHFAKKELKQARTCYDHIAGELGVKIKDFLISENIIIAANDNSGIYSVTPSGEIFFAEELKINIENLKKKKRKFCIDCLDWSERKNHLAGALANAILDFLLNNDYVTQATGSRALKITDTGEKFFKDNWHIILTQNDLSQ